jgi:KaiC/GvpD/RAD55 family RecA-like ATPase
LKRRAKVEYSGGSSQADGGAISAAKDEEVIDSLKRWLERKDANFLDWIEETESDGEVCHDTKEVEALQEAVAEYEMEIAQLKRSLKFDQPAEGAELGAALSEKVSTLIEERDALRVEKERLVKLNEEQKANFERSMEGVSEDKSSLLIKEMELHELESRLESQQLEMESKAAGAKVKTAKELEKEISERYSIEIRDKEDRWRLRESELKAQIDQLERELTRVTVDLKIKQEQTKLGNMSSPEAKAEIERKLGEMQSKEKDSLLIKVQLDNLKSELSVREDEVNRLREAINKKEEEMARREEDLQYKEKLLTAERLKLEESKQELIGVEQSELKKRLEELSHEIKAKEAEVKNKEKWLTAKSEELRMRESGIIDEELKVRQKETLLELQALKVKSGNPRLDDLLYGGIPVGSNIMVHGPPFIGKEVLVDVFIADGLKKGVPALWVITDKTAKDIREEMKFVISGYEEFEKKGLVKYIDTYSRSMGDESNDPYSIYIDDPTDHETLAEVIEASAKEFKEKAPYYRMALRSISTLIAYSDPNSAFRFLSPMCGRRKKDGAVALYVIEKGVHGDQEIQMIGSIMDGMFDFKLDQMKTFFSVQGIADVQSRSYIRYTFTKHSLNIGSFALDHIR